MARIDGCSQIQEMVFLTDHLQPGVKCAGLNQEPTLLVESVRNSSAISSLIGANQRTAVVAYKLGKLGKQEEKCTLHQAAAGGASSQESFRPILTNMGLAQANAASIRGSNLA